MNVEEPTAVSPEFESAPTTQPAAPFLLQPEKPTLPVRLLRRRALPRAVRVALSLSRGTITFLLFLFFCSLAGAFAAGFVVARRTAEVMVVERVVPAGGAPKPAQSIVNAPPQARPEMKRPDAKAGAEAPELAARPKLAITIGPPDDERAFGIQIAAYPDLRAAEASLDDWAGALIGHSIYIVPAEIRGKGVWHRVRIGLYPTRAQAEKARASLPEELSKSAMVVSYK